ncbi:MAG: hypothetical protein LBR26_01140 [Prevotella sp.]|nr:hypothetical protein [Prevotella sp.]
MQKTRQPLYLPLSMQARKWMPERDGAAEADGEICDTDAFRSWLKSVQG